MTDADRALEPFVHRLPLDVMQEIFISCLPTKHYAVLSLDHAPLLLCRICRFWSALAHSLPRLWLTLHIPLGLSSSAAAVPIRGSPEMPIELMRRVLVAVKSWLKRSGAFPLSLSVKIFPDTVATRRTAQFLEFLMKSFSRWKAITLTGNESVEKFLAVSRTLDRCPVLKELTIRMHTGGPNAGMWDLLRVPTLRRVFLKFDIPQPLELPLL
ncbi:hypothetical protein DFH08DRAFT_703757 [Mycena albidolilacea]|uniref:F-box domain-containing protein n=1 Tax=Mycena albidolilacea TaxID=1033008 RepID=A0AAD7EPW4_9AGAR|nr:hypothetical protein DFH08DRAFT_703757 [Mycena albidolilacea]